MCAVQTPQTTITSDERKRCLDLRSKIVLTDNGAKFYTSRSLHLHSFDSPEGDRKYGFKLKALDMPWLKRLLLAGFVDKAEFPVKDLSSVKNEIGDLARLVVFSMHYGYFRSSTISRVVDSEVMHRWNRAHPHQAMDARNAQSPLELKNALKSRSAAVDALKKEVADPVLRSIAVDGRHNEDERKRLSYFVYELLNNLDSLVYFVLLCSNEKERIKIIADIQDLIRSCVDRVDIADYLALMVLELMGAAERSTLIEMIGSNMRPSEVRSTLEDPSKRSELLSRLPNGLASAMVWSLSRRWSLDRWRYRLRLSMHDGSSSFEDSLRLFEERGRLSVGDKSLLELYEHGSGPYGDDGLGWYYLSFIAEACDHMGVSFEASVRERAGRGTTSVNLYLGF